MLGMIYTTPILEFIISIIYTGVLIKKKIKEYKGIEPIESSKIQENKKDVSELK